MKGSALTSSDHSLSLTVPKDWKQPAGRQPSPLILVAQGSDRVDQLLVSKFDGEKKAEDEAVFTVTGLADTGVECKRTRLHRTLVFDCPGTYQGKSYRRLFFPIPHNGESYLLLIQTPGETLAEAGRVAEPIVKSVKFR